MDVQTGTPKVCPTGVFAPGYVFCVRVACWKQPLFRYVGPDDGTPNGRHPRLPRPCPPTQRVRHPRILDNETYRQAFDAWESARNDVVNKWNHLAEKVNLEPRVPPALTRAADIVRSHAPPTLTQDQIDRAID